MGRQSSEPPNRQNRPRSITNGAPTRPKRSLDQRQRNKLLKTTDLPTIRFAVFLFLTVSLLLLSIAFFSTNWLEAEQRYYGSRLRKLGLWRVCFKSFNAPDDFEFRKFYVGCRWIFSEEYKPIRKFLLPAFFIITQVLFTAGFLLLVLVCTGIIAVQQFFSIEREDYALRALSIASLLSAISCTSAVTLFAINRNQEDWMPHPDQNYLSWSFAAALIGSLLLWVSSLLFYIDMQLIIRRNRRQGPL